MCPALTIAQESIIQHTFTLIETPVLKSFISWQSQHNHILLNRHLIIELLLIYFFRKWHHGVSRHILECLRGRHAQPQGAVYSLKCIHNISTQHWISTVCVCNLVITDPVRNFRKMHKPLLRHFDSLQCVMMPLARHLQTSLVWLVWILSSEQHTYVLGSRVFGFETFKRPYSSYLMVISLKYIAFLDFLDCFAEQNLLTCCYKDMEYLILLVSLS